MGFNKKVLSKAVSELGKAKAPGKPKDIIVDPAGQWKYPGQETRIPSNDITMQGVDYPVWAQPNVGPGTMMYPGQDYQFPGADYVDETPMAKKGGTAGKLSSGNKTVTKVVNIKFDLPDLSGAKKIDDKVTLAMSPDSSGVFTIGKDVEKFSGIKESEVKADIAAGKESPEDAIIYGLTNVMNGGKDVYLWINGSRLQGMAKKHGADEAITEVVSHEAIHLARHLITRAIAKKKGLNLNNEDWIKHDYGAGEYNWPAVGDESKENPIVQIDEESFATAEGIIVEQILPYFKEMAKSYLNGADSKEFKKGGTLQSKKYSKSMSATNKLMAKNKLFENKKSKIFDPNAKFKSGGSKLGPINLNPNPLSHYELNYGFNLPIKQDGGESDYEELELTPEEIQAYKDAGYVVDELPEQEIGGYVQHEIAKAQTGLTKKPLVIADPKEFAYRNKMYNDSLSLYNGYKFQKKTLAPFGPVNYNYPQTNFNPEDYKPNKLSIDKVVDAKKLLKAQKYEQVRQKYGSISNAVSASPESLSELKKLRTLLPDLENANLAKATDKIINYYKSIGIPYNQINLYSSPDLYHPKIKPIGEYMDGVAASPIYKKPVQPIKFIAKQDELKSPIPVVNTDTERFIPEVIPQLPLRELQNFTMPEPVLQINNPQLPLKQYNSKTGKWSIGVHRPDTQEFINKNKQQRYQTMLENGQANMVQPTFQTGGTRKPLVITDPKEFAYRDQMYKDSLSLYNQSQKIGNVGLPKISKEKYDEIERKNLDTPFYYFDNKQYNTDKKNKIYKSFNDYVITSTNGTIYDHPVYKKNNPDIVTPTYSDLEKHSIKLKNGNIKVPMDINNNKPDFSSYTIYNPNTGTTQFYSVDYLTNKPQLLDVYNNKIKPTITNYYGSDKPILDGTINVSEKSKTNNKLTSQLNKKYKNYWHEFTYRDLYEKPVQPVTFKKTNTPINKVNTLIPSNPEDIGLLPLRKINTQPVLTPEIIKGNYPLPVRKQYRKGVWSDGSKGKLPMGMSTEDYKRKNQEYITNLLKRNNVFTQTFQKGGSKIDNYEILPETFNYEGRPGARYRRDNYGNWLIADKNTNGKFVAVKDKTGKRQTELNKNAISSETGKTVTQYNKEFDESPEGRMMKRKSLEAQGINPDLSGPQSAGNSDWFWGPAALAITGAPAVAQAVKTAAPLVSSALNTAPSWLPGATINNALTAGFAGHGLYNIASGNVAEPWKKAMETGKGMDYVNALGENLMTALEVAPLVGPSVKGVSNLLKAGKSTKMPVGLKGSPNATEAVENINIVRTPGIPQKPLPSFDTVNNAYDDLLMQSGNNELMARAEIADRYGREALNILDNPPTITSYPQTGSINLSRPVNHRANLNSLLNETELNINTPGYELPELSYDDFINQGLNSVSSPRETEQLTNMINDVQLRNRYEILRTRQRQGNQQLFNSPNALHNADGSLILSDAERASLSNIGSASSAQPAYARRTIRDFGQQNINTGPANRYTLDDFTNLNTNEINDSLLTGLRDYQNKLIQKQSLSKKIASKLSNVKNTFSTTLSDINQGIGDIIDSSKVDSLKKQIKATDIEADVNKLLENGLGIKKGDIKIKVLADPKNNDVKVLLNPYEYFSKNKDLIESTYGEGTYDEWMKSIGKDDWIDSGHLTLNPTFPEQASPRTFTQILSGKKFKPSTKFGLGLDINLPAPGLKRAGDFPFENWNSDFREKILDNLGVSGELTQALKQASQNKGYEIYSGGTGHLYPGAKRYLRELLNDRVEIMNPEKADKLYYLLNDQDVLQKVNEALLNKEKNLPSDVHYALQNLIFKYKRKGGEMDSWEDELDDEEIERLKRAGYVVEEVGKYQTGGNVSDVWQKVTGTPWSEAKQKGFTSGSYDDNINLLNDLNSGKYSTSNPTSPFDTKAPVNISSDAKIKTAKNFNEAFSIARSTMGANQIFEYNGRKYGTNLKGENFTPSDNVLKASGLDTTKVKDRLVDQNKQLESPFLNKKTVKLEPDAYVSWEKVKQKNLDINKQSNAQKIIEYNKNKKNSKPYVIVDKKKGLMHIYDQSGKNLFTSAIDLGKNKGDAQTVTKYKDINKDGKINDADKVNGKFKVDWTAGNMNTGAGKFYIAHIDTKGYEGLPILNMMNEAQYDKFKKTGKIESIATSMHKGYVKDDKSRISNGCIRCNKTTLDNLVKYLSNTSEVYILPEDEKNEFVFENGKLNFKVGSGKDYNTYSDSMGRVQKGQGINKSTKTLNYIPIKTVLDKEKFKDEVFTALDFDDESEYQNVKQYTDALAKNKYKIMKATKINGDVYNELAKMSFGILGTESNYADTHKGFNNLGRAINKYFSPSTASSPDYESKYDTYGATENYRSVGLTQIRWNYLNTDEKKALKELGITSNKDFLNPKKAAIATTAILAIRYQQQLTNKEKEDMWKYLPTKWNNRSNYASRVKNNSKYMSIMQQNKND